MSYIYTFEIALLSKKLQSNEGVPGMKLSNINSLKHRFVLKMIVFFCATQTCMIHDVSIYFYILCFKF